MTVAVIEGSYGPGQTGFMEETNSCYHESTSGLIIGTKVDVHVRTCMMMSSLKKSTMTAVSSPKLSEITPCYE